MSENIQMTDPPARLKRLAGLLAFVILTAATCLLFSGSTLSGTTEATQLGGPTEVSGIIDTDTTWTLANSPCIVTGNILVSQGVTLTIEAGVEVRFDGYYYLRVDGTLIADGTPEDPIIFTSSKTNPTPGDWNTIRFASTGTPATYDENGNYIGGSMMRYCRIEYAYAGAYLESSPLISHSIFAQNGSLSWKESYPGGAIVIGSCSPVSPIIVIADNTMTDNQGEGGAIRAFGCQPIIERNVIEGNQGSLAGAIVFTAGRGRISSNHILRNSGGYYGGDRVGGIFVNYSSVLIEKNLIAANSGVAIFMQMQTSVLNNAMTRNSGEAVIHLYSQVDSPPLIRGNNIYDNTANYDISVKDVPGRIGASAENNWWGTTDTAVIIEERIYDFYDDFNLGEVTYTPILTAPSTSAPSLLSDLSLDPPSPLTPQPVGMILDFSVPMDTSVSPTVSFGLTSPYIQYQVTSGSWISPTQWVGNYDLTGMPDGGYTVWVSGAVSAEDGIRVEDTRFGFVVTPVSNWILVDTDTDPSPKMNMALAYNSGRGKAVLFGGYGYGAYLDDTWEYDGTDWVQVETANSPPARIWHGLAYDSNRGKAVLFGGQDENDTWLDDTWEYDGADWTQVNTTNTPGGRSGWGMAYDSARSKLVLFGGKADNETWEYDGMDWVQVETVTKPPARSTPRLVYDSGRGKVVLFGGSTDLDDTWEYDGTDWVEVNTASKPSARRKHAMAYDSQRGKVVLFGGWDGSNCLDDTWEYDGTDWVQVSTSISPPAKTEHSMTYDSGRGKVVLFGMGNYGFYSNQRKSSLRSFCMD